MTASVCDVTLLNWASSSRVACRKSLCSQPPAWRTAPAPGLGRGAQGESVHSQSKEQGLIPLQPRPSFMASLSFFFDYHPGSKQQSFQRHNSFHSYKQVHLVEDTQRTKAFL